MTPEFEHAARLYAEALAIHRFAVAVHARCHRRKAGDRGWRAVVREVPMPVAHAPSAQAQPVAVPSDTTVEQLTPRQREVVRLISRGCTNAEIAEALVVTRGTAANHVAAILSRLGAANRTQVAAWAIAAGLIER